MAAKKAQAAARFVTEVAPPQVVSVMRRRRKKVGLDTIVEDDMEQQLAYGPSSSDHQGFAAAWSRRPPARERPGGLMRELSKHFLNGDGQHEVDAGSEGGHKLGHRRGVKI